MQPSGEPIFAESIDRPANEPVRDPMSYWVLAITLLVALVHGLIYLWIMPPWQHYDEPKHFEVAWLVSRLNRMPLDQDADPALSRSVLESMVLNNFYGKGYTPDQFIRPDQPVYIPGISQFSEKPLYYFLASLPLRFLGGQPVETQLYGARLVSLTGLLVTVWASWGVARDLTSPGSPLRWMLPLTVAMLPGFVDLMTAVNNDSASVAVFSLFIWASLRMIVRGFNWLDFVWATAMVVLAYFTKTTTLIALPLLALALLFSLLRGRLAWVAWVIALGGVALALAAAIQWGDAAYWYRASLQPANIRQENPQAIAGEHVLQLDATAAANPVWTHKLSQPVPAATGADLQGKTYTLGVWMWANQPAVVESPIVGVNDESFSYPVELGTQPRFFALEFTLPERRFNRTNIRLDPKSSEATPGLVVYYDGLVLAEGKRPADQTPFFTSPDGSHGAWGEEPFTNLLRNGSGEISGPRMRSWVDRLSAEFVLDELQPSLILTFLTDVAGAGYTYSSMAERLFRTFWGYFGWGHIPMTGAKPYRLMLAATLLGLVGAFVWIVLSLVKNRKSFPWSAVIFLLAVLSLAWGAPFLRGAIYLTRDRLFLPVARYGYVAIIPTLLILVTGWMTLIGKTADLLRLPRMAGWILYTGLFLTLDIASLYSILSYYQGL